MNKIELLKMGKYFNSDETFGTHSVRTLRIADAGGGDVPEGNGWQIIKGGMISPKGKLVQGDVVAYCETEKEAKELIEKLIAL